MLRLPHSPTTARSNKNRALDLVNCLKVKRKYQETNMSHFHSESSPFRVLRENGRIIFENEYVRWVHDPACGGELTGAFVKNGSGGNLIRRRQTVAVALEENWNHHPFCSGTRPAESLDVDEKGEFPRIAYTQKLYDKEGKCLSGTTVRHTVEYHPWGYANHRVELHVEKRIENLSQVQVGSFYAASGFDALAYRECGLFSASIRLSGIARWRRLYGGRSRDDAPAFLARRLPVSLLFLKRGVEALEFSLGDDLAAWDHVGTSVDGMQIGYVSYEREAGGYEVRIAPLDICWKEQFLEEGVHPFTFRMSMPHVRPNITPLRSCASNLLVPSRGFENRWPRKEDFEKMRLAGIDLMRIHNDGDPCGNGIFWRDGAYPPYPPEEMEKMDRCLALAKEYGISVVPYFSVKEFHPEASDYAECAEDWARISDERAGLIINGTRNGIFGVQMCLASGWKQKRRNSIECALKNHAFNGVYYDWCTGLECVNIRHSSGRHWDNDLLLEHIEWSHSLAGKNGEVYLHLTHTPSLALENMASLVLTEESSFAELGPEMFSQHVHFLNVVPRQICNMLPPEASDADRRRLAMCALLHHATVSSMDPAFLELSRTPWLREVTKYTRHSAPGEGRCFSSCPQIGTAVYWNGTEALAVFANLSETTEDTDYSFDLPGGPVEGKISLDGLELKAVRFEINGIA